MKIDFYDLFSLHTPKDFPDAGEGNYITAAVKSKVMENASANKSKPVRISRIGRAVITAAAAVVVLITCAFAASALGLIDLERIFGGLFDSGTEYLEGITAVPQDVVTTGDDRLSLKVLGIGGTENEVFGAIEIKRTDGGVFPEHMKIASFGSLDPVGADFIISNELDVIDETTAIIYFRNEAVYSGINDSLIGTTYTYKVSRIIDNAEIVKLQEKYDMSYVDDEEDRAYLEYLRENENVVLDGEWTVSFPLDYNIEKRSVSVNEPLNAGTGIITGVEYSAITLDISLEEAVNYGLPIVMNVKLNGGEEFTVSYSYSSFVEEEKTAVVHFSFDKPIDVDSVESIRIGDKVIPVK